MERLSELSACSPSLAPSDNFENIKASPIDLYINPSPDDFVAFVPWANDQFNTGYVVTVHKTLQGIDGTSKAKKNGHGQGIASSEQELSQQLETECSILIKAMYSIQDKLVELQIVSKKPIPREVFKVIAFTLPYNQTLTTVKIDAGLDMYGIHELRNFLKLSNIVEIVLDDTFVAEANYYILLNAPSRIRYLSLARCHIGNKGVKPIASRLAFGSPASSTLYVLNLSSNNITDVGAKYLATALRSNRCIAYLSLANNSISDDGAKQILNVLQQFPLTFQEVIQKNGRYVKHLKKKQEIIDQYLQSLNQRVEPPLIVNKKVKKSDKSRKISDTSPLKIDEVVRSLIGDFKDPFLDCVTRDGVVHSNGNNTLMCLNLAYNHLTFLSLKMILNVVQHQKTLNRTPKGLLHITVDGNPMPQTCTELNLISDLLNAHLERETSKTVNTGNGHKKGAKSAKRSTVSFTAIS